MDEIPYFEARSFLRREDHRLITGAGRYVADLAPPETVHLAFVRSTEAHGLITAIATNAVDGAGVVGVFTAEDLNSPTSPETASPPRPLDFPGHTSPMRKSATSASRSRWWLQHRSPPPSMPPIRSGWIISHCLR